MIHWLDFLRDLSIPAIFIRLLLATICGGVIGAEREYKQRPAGFRTHILICLGATMTTLTSQYLVLEMGYITDIGRLGAQVVAGIGFIGAGTIIVTRRQHVKGLTTAAGLWTAAIIGLAIGSGYYEIGVLSTVLILIAELLLIKVEYMLIAHDPEINLYIEYTDKNILESVLQLCHDFNITVLNMEFTHTLSTNGNAGMILSLRMSPKCSADKFVDTLCRFESMTAVQEL